MHDDLVADDPVRQVSGVTVVNHVAHAAPSALHALRVLLLCHQQILAVGVQHALTAAGLQVVATGRSLADVDTTVLDPQVLLLVGSSSTDVASAVEETRRSAPGLPVVVLGDEETSSGTAMLAALVAGADGWLDLDSSPDVVERTVRAVHRGETGISRQHVARLLSALRRPGGRVLTLGDGRVVTLTRREHQVLTLVSQGSSTRLVAERLGVAAGTARWHIAGLAKKLGVAGRDEVASLGRFAGTHRVTEGATPVGAAS